MRKFNCIDLFAGLGGLSTGAVMAGHNVVWAGNHWDTAVKYHQLNHPNTEHVCQDLQQANFYQLPSYDCLLASPACQGHSLGRGRDLARHEVSRSTAWAVVEALEAGSPPLFEVENVEKFTDWNLFKAWKYAIESLGYSLSINLLDAADYGVPQNRLRNFIIGTKSKKPLPLKLEKQAPVTARSVIDLDSGNWSPIKTKRRSPKTLARIERGRRELKTDTFLIPYYSSGSGLTGRSLDRPIGTLTTVDRYGIVRGDEMRMLTVDEMRKFMSFPDDTKLPPQHKIATKLLGNAVPPLLQKQILEYVAAAA